MLFWLPEDDIVKKGETFFGLDLEWNVPKPFFVSGDWGCRIILILTVFCDILLNRLRIDLLFPVLNLLFHYAMKWGNKKVLVTGAGGFIGSLVERLVEMGAQVWALVRCNSRNDWGLLEILPPSGKGRLEITARDIIKSLTITRAMFSKQEFSLIYDCLSDLC